jgi:hypothetical protein
MMHGDDDDDLDDDDLDDDLWCTPVFRAFSELDGDFVLC